MSITIAATLIAYKLLLLAIGFWAQQRTQNNEDFFSAGASLAQWWLPLAIAPARHPPGPYSA